MQTGGGGLVFISHRLITDYPLMVLKIAYTVVLRMSTFMRQIDFGLGENCLLGSAIN